MAEATEITFEAGYERLQAIADRVNAEKVPVHEMCDLFAEGKGLDKALTAYLAEQKTRVEKIENGEEIQAFRIVAPSGDDVEDDGPGDVPADTADFAPAPSFAIFGAPPTVDLSVRDNRVRDAGVDGFSVGTEVGGPISGLLLAGNSAQGSGDDGFDVRDPETTLRDNLAFHNADLGIDAVAGVTDGGGNRAFGNGNPLQCTNVLCH